MTNEITVEMLDRKIAWGEQNAFWGNPSAIQRMQDFYFEKTRTSVNEAWSETFSSQELADALGVEQVRYRIYYSRDDLTCRLFVFRAHCTKSEEREMLALGFVHAQDGDTNNIPDQPVEEHKGWVCPKCGVDRTRDVCPKGHTAALTGDCPMTATAQ
jgi:hypothetical protein